MKCKVFNVSYGSACTLRKSFTSKYAWFTKSVASILGAVAGGETSETLLVYAGAVAPQIAAGANSARFRIRNRKLIIRTDRECHELSCHLPQRTAASTESSPAHVADR